MKENTISEEVRTDLETVLLNKKDLFENYISSLLDRVLIKKADRPKFCCKKTYLKTTRIR